MKTGQGLPWFPQVCRGFSLVYYILFGLCSCLAFFYLTTVEFKTNSWRAILYTMGFRGGFRTLWMIDYSLVFLTLASAARSVSLQRSPLQALAKYFVITTLFVAFLLYTKIEIAGSGLVEFDPSPPGHKGSWMIAAEVPVVRKSELIKLVVVFNIPLVPVLILMGIQSLLHNRNRSPTDLQEQVIQP